MRTTRIIPALALAALLIGAWPAVSSAQWVIESKDQKTNLKIGFLLQPQFESLETADESATSKNIFLRRFRILFGGKIADKWTYFFETDSPNVGKGTGTSGTKDAGTIYMQDAFVTYNHNDAFKVDVGMLLLAQSHNHIQSAASLLPVDYGAYTFVESTPTAERVGRDYGVQFRGLPFKQHFEYRLGVFSGVRGTDSANELRVAGRGTWFPFAAEAGYFYTGTFLGQKRMVAIGGSFDKQKSYGMYGFDAFYEQPINKGQQGFTVQFDYNRVDGGTFLTALPKQDNMMVEAAFHFGKGKFSPFVQYAARNYDTSTTADQNQLQAGIAWWLAGHNRNLKFSVGRQHTEGAPDRTQALLQFQIFYY
jgi:hypothetical protein